MRVRYPLDKLISSGKIVLVSFGVGASTAASESALRHRSLGGPVRRLEVSTPERCVWCAPRRRHFVSFGAGAVSPVRFDTGRAYEHCLPASLVNTSVDPIILDNGCQGLWTNSCINIDSAWRPDGRGGLSLPDSTTKQVKPDRGVSRRWHARPGTLLVVAVEVGRPGQGEQVPIGPGIRDHFGEGRPVRQRPVVAIGYGRR